MKSISIDPNNSVYDSRNNCNAIVETATNTLKAGCKNTIIPASITEIGKGAFYGHLKLKKITIPKSIKTIGKDAFGMTGLESIVVNKENTVFDSRENCNAIIETNTNTLIVGCKKTVIPNSVTEIGDYAFERCFGLSAIYIPNSVKKIGDYAFKHCFNIKTINIPDSIEQIGTGAFVNCEELMEDDEIYYKIEHLNYDAFEDYDY